MSLLSLHGLSQYFPTREGGLLRAVSEVDLDIAEGEVVGLVGESGCGKSTLGRTLLRLLEPAAGRILFAGRDITRLPKREMRRVRRDMQIVFQDPFGSLNPRHRVGAIIGEPLKVQGIGDRTSQAARVAELIDLVGLPEGSGMRYPHEFSGGQRQRIAIARALALDPRLVVMDEAVSALDVSIQSQILNLVADLRARLGLAILFISHDLSVVRHVSDRIAVMYLGRVVEIGPAEEVMSRPLHPYTRALIASIPVVGPRAARRARLDGEVPDPAHPPAGCAFHTRCPMAMPRCQEAVPPLIPPSGEGTQRAVACVLHQDAP